MFTREIKFKALAEHNNGEKEWFYYTTETGKILTDMYVNQKIKHWIVKDLQFTGLKDANGKEIFEGELLKIKTKAVKNIEKFEVIFDKKNAKFILDTPYFNLGGQSIFYEVIGNIYECGKTENPIKQTPTKNT